MRRRHQEHPSRSDADRGPRVELTLTLTPGPEGTATVHATSPEGAAQGRLALPADVLRGDPTAFPRAGGRDVSFAGPAGPGAPTDGVERVPLDPREAGARLFEALVSDPGVHGLYESTRATATPERLRLRIVVDPDGPSMEAVHALPWELLHDRDRGERLACEGGVSIVRSLTVRRPPRPFEPRKTLRVLVLLSGAPDLDLERERGLMEDLAHQTAGLEVTCEAAGDLATLERILIRAAETQSPFHVLHLAGHGEIAAGPEGGVLAWEPAGRPRSEISGRNLSALLRGFPELRMVVLNACTTAELPGEGRDPFAGVAAALLRGGVPVVVGVRGAIRDDAAVRFTETFYRRLAGGRTPEESMRAARWALWVERPEGVEWAKPVLFQAAAERRAGLPRWLVRTAAGLAAALLLLAALALQQRRALGIREVERSLAAAVTDLSHTRPDAARRTLESALGRLPFPPPDPELRAALHATLAVAEQDLGELEAALDHSRTAVELDPDRPAHRYNLGVLLARAGRAAEAVAPLRKALELDPRHAGAANELGCVYLDGLERPGDARVVLEPAVAAHPDHGLLHKNLGRTLLALGEAATAARALERALQILPWEERLAREEARFHLARAAAAMGDDARACAALAAFAAPARGSVSDFRDEAARLGRRVDCSGAGHAP